MSGKEVGMSLPNFELHQLRIRTKYYSEQFDTADRRGRWIVEVVTND